MGRILAIDPGEKRVGLALSDMLKLIASPYEIIPFKSSAALAERIKSIVVEKDVELVVV